MDKDFIRTGNIEIKTQPLTLEKLVIEVKTGDFRKDPNLSWGYSYYGYWATYNIVAKTIDSRQISDYIPTLLLTGYVTLESYWISMYLISPL